MQSAADSVDQSRAALWAAMHDYARSPGKYQVNLRQPLLLFAELRELLQMAVGRQSDAGQGANQDASLRDAARFFVRTALLYPGADHYAVLGVDRKTEGAELKDRYRLMMRLLHPDYSDADSRIWPADAAVRVNRAYDVLSSPVQRRGYEETLAQVHGAAPLHTTEARRPVAPPRQVNGPTRQLHFKQLAAIFAVAGIAVVVISIFATGSPESGQLVQRSPVKAEPNLAEAPVLAYSSAAMTPSSKDVKVAEARTTARSVPVVPKSVPMPVPPPKMAVIPQGAPQVVARSTLRQTAPEPVLGPAVPAPRIDRVAPVAPSRAPDPKPELVALAAPLVAFAAPVAAPAPLQAPALAAALPPPVQPVAPARPAFKAGPTLTEAQPLLSQLLQVMESGRGERILNLLDAEARAKPSAQALSRQYDSLVDGARPVRVSHVEFKAEPGDGRLLVVGYLRVMAGEQTIGSLGKKMVLRAEFASREGSVVITGLSGGPIN